MFLVPADFKGVLGVGSVARCAVQHTELHCERGSGALGFSDYLSLSSAEAVGKAGFAPFPKSCRGSLHPQLHVSDGSGPRGGSGALCSLFAARSD